jgi:CelD/BcsL family acetyltransferase involved in cellulose biosynthesis
VTTAETDAIEVTVSFSTSLEQIGEPAWNELWHRSEISSVFARYEWMAAWEKAFVRGKPLKIYTAKAGGSLVGILALAPSREGSGPLVLLGHGHADYAGILTDPRIPKAFPTILEAACSDLGAGGRLSLSEIRSDTSYFHELENRCARPGSRWLRTEQTVCPRTEITPERVQTITNKDSLKRHSRKLRKLGAVAVRHEVDPVAILPRLDAFFSQHIARWAHTDSPSLFLDQRNRVFYRELVHGFADTDQLVFTEVTLDGRPVAFHLGFLSEDHFIWYKPSFEPALAKVSPGETLLRELFLWSLEKGLTGFDFTRGGESFKARFATSQRHTATYVYFGNRLSLLSAQTWQHAQRIGRERLPAPVATVARRWLHWLRADWKARWDSYTG